jgi:hypothetical protein
MSSVGLVAIEKTLVSGAKLAVGVANFGAEEVFAETKDLDLDSQNEKYVDFLLFEFEGEEFIQGLTVEINTKDRRKETSVQQTLVISGSDEPVPLDPPVTARYFKLKISDNQPTGRWKCSGIEFHGEMMEGRLASA